MNRTLENSILFTSPIGRQITELRAAGGRLVLYTESNEVYKQFKEWKQLIQMVPYNSGKNLVGVDLYFPREARKALIRALTSKEEVSAR